MGNDKYVLIDFETHRKLKVRATLAGRTIKAELKIILDRLLEELPSTDLFIN